MLVISKVYLNIINSHETIVYCDAHTHTATLIDNKFNEKLF